jgi:uncharacterized membrane protein
MILRAENRIDLTEICTSAPLSTTNQTWTEISPVGHIHLIGTVLAYFYQWNPNQLTALSKYLIQ